MAKLLRGGGGGAVDDDDDDAVWDMRWTERRHWLRRWNVGSGLDARLVCGLVGQLPGPTPIAAVVAALAAVGAAVVVEEEEEEEEAVAGERTRPMMAGRRRRVDLSGADVAVVVVVVD